MNVALHGMEEAAGVRYIPTGTNAGTARPGSPVAGGPGDCPTSKKSSTVARTRTRGCWCSS
jgi:hypothetical protein